MAITEINRGPDIGRVGADPAVAPALLLLG